MHRQTSLVAMSSLFSHKNGNPSFRPDKPDTSLIVDPPPPPPPPPTSTTPPGTLAIPNPKQHPLSLDQPEVENKTMTKYVPQRRNRVGTVVTRSVFDACVETKGSFLSSSCFEESSCEHPARLDLLQSCFFCRRSLSMARDIYIYRGDRAFCSTDCRYQQIVIDERNSRCSHTSSMPGSRPRTYTAMYTS